MWNCFPHQCHRLAVCRCERPRWACPYENELRVNIFASRFAKVFRVLRGEALFYLRLACLSRASRVVVRKHAVFLANGPLGKSKRTSFRGPI